MKKLIYFIKLMTNNHSLITICCLLLTAHCSLFTVHAQQVSNIRAAQQDKKIIISYDLTGKQGVNDYEIKLYVSINGGSTWEQVYSGLSGAIGAKQTAGMGKTITWDVLSSRDKLQGDNIKFKVTATYNEGGVNYTETAGGVNMDMVFVKGGTFTMGCKSEQGSDCESDEKPAHSVTLSDYYIGKFEVTQAQWKAITGSNPSHFKDCDNCPVESVSWNNVLDFITKLNEKTGKTYSLPTEMQWEYASRGGDKSNGYKFSGSDDALSVAWFGGNSVSETHPVGQKKPNELGIYDMAGNVCEFCSNWYKGYPNSIDVYDYGGSRHVLRGDSFYSSDLHSSSDRFCTDKEIGEWLGFRLVLVP